MTHTTLGCLTLAGFVASTVVGCRSAHAQTQPAPLAPAAPAPQSAPPATPAQIDPDGTDDAVVDTGSGALPDQMHFERVGRPPHGLHRVCALTPHNGALYAAHANTPLDSDGATITRYQPDATPAFTIAFDWNRPGQPTQGGGAGQGFLRIHDIGGRLFVPDADPPYAGFGYVDPATEGYVYVSDHAGHFAPARGERFHPPSAPDENDRAGAGVLPRAYHVLDVIRYRGRFYASTGSVPPGQRAWSGPSPGALHVANAHLSRWTYEVDYPYPWQNGVWRLTFMVRFRDRLYAGIQDYNWREPNDYVYFNPPAASTSIGRQDLHPMRLTHDGGAQTLRWYADGGKLYWLALEHGGVVTLRVTDDGDHWESIAIPDEGGRPVDITRFRDHLVILTERGLYRLDGASVTRLGHIDDARSPFALTDIFCAAPLGVYRNQLFAGGQRDGALYRWVDGPAAAPRGE